MGSIQDTLDKLSAIQRGVAEAGDTIARRAAETALDAKIEALDEGTYSRLIPTNAARSKKSGGAARRSLGRGGGSKPAWKRTGALKSDQAVVKVARGRYEVRNVGASAAYEGAVANLPTGPDNVNRSNPAAQKGQRKAETELPAIIEEELRSII